MLKYWGSIWSHRLANYSVPITGSWKQIMHQVTSPPSLDLAHGRGSTKCQIYRGQHSHQDLSPTDNALVSAKEQSEKNTFLIQHWKGPRTQAAGASKEMPLRYIRELLDSVPHSYSHGSHSEVTSYTIWLIKQRHTDIKGKFDMLFIWKAQIS